MRAAEESKESWQMEIQFPPGAPFQLHFSEPSHSERFTKHQRDSKIRIGILKYVDRLQTLAAQKVAEELKSSLPDHFRRPTRVLVAILSDGIALRFEPSTTCNEVVILSLRSSLAEFVPKMTLGLVAILSSRGELLHVEGVPAPTLGMNVQDATGATTRKVIDGTEFRLGLVMPERPAEPTSQRVPKAELIRNEFVVEMEGVQVPEQITQAEGRPFATRGRIRFPGYWDAVSIYPWAEKDLWREADFGEWAESHFFQIAYHVASSEHAWQFRASQRNLRDWYEKVLAGFDQLLSTPNVREEDLQQYISRHPEIIVAGYKRVLPKLRLGPHVTDFVLEDPTGNYLLVELENPSQPLFIKSGHRSSSLTHAVGQVEDWIRYIQDNKSTVERELQLPGISATPHALVVIGRSHSLTDAQRRKLLVDQSRIEVVTYDDLKLRFAKTLENLLGMLGNAQELAI